MLAELERMELEVDLASYDAKLKVLDSFHESSGCQHAVQENNGKKLLCGQLYEMTYIYDIVDE